jgi:8-oxo-dGTP diphosphatase
MKLLCVVAVVLIDLDGRILLSKRPSDKAHGGLWEFPGGKLKIGETPEDCLIRELHEELGITVKAACLSPLTFASHAYDDFHLFMPLYGCRRFEGTPISRKGQELKWVQLRDIKNYPMPPADIPLIPLIPLLMDLL